MKVARHRSWEELRMGADASAAPFVPSASTSAAVVVTPQPLQPQQQAASNLSNGHHLLYIQRNHQRIHHPGTPPLKASHLSVIEEESIPITLPSTSGGGGGAGGAVVAIDNKIEQAMDLVKTHLMYAVREEIEALRGKIVDLEKKLGRVEAENRSLRAAASPEVLAQIEAQAAAAAASTATATPQPSTPATATAAAGGNPPLSAVSASQSQSQCPPTAPTQQPPPPASQAPQ